MIKWGIGISFLMIFCTPSSLFAGEINFSVTTLTVGENAGLVQVEVTLDVPELVDISFTFGATGGTTTTGGSDYTMSASPFTIPAGSTSENIDINVTDDLLDEDAELLVLWLATITAGPGTFGIVRGYTLTINDNDSPPGVSLALSAPSISENAATSDVIATLDALSGKDVIVDLNFAGSATATADFTASGNVLTIPAGSISSAVTVTGVDDVIDEVDETVVVTINSITNGSELGGVGTQSETLTLIDDEGVPTVSLSVDQANIGENGDVATVTGTLDVVSGQDITVKVSTGGTATITDDYTISADSIVILAGQFTGTMLISAVSEGVYEVNETVTIDIDSIVGSNATENGVQQITTTITDATPLPTVTLSLSADTIAEGLPSTITATLSAVSTEDVVVNYTFAGDAVEGGTDDYTKTGTTVTILAGTTAKAMSVNTIDDTEVELDESIDVSISGITNATEAGGGSAQDKTVTITSDDVTTLSVAVSAPSGSEVSGPFYVIASLDNVTYQDVVVTFSYAGSAVITDDYTLDLGDANNGLQLTISAGDTKDSVRVTMVDNLLWEQQERVEIAVTSVTNAVDASATRFINITDNEAVPRYTIEADKSVQEDAGTTTITVLIDQKADIDIPVYFRTFGTARKAADGDFTIVASPITILKGTLSTDIDITLVDDAIYEPDQTVYVSLDSASYIYKGADTLSILTITDEDSPPNVTLSGDASISEDGGVSTIVATLDLVSEVTSYITIQAAGVDSTPVQYTLSGTTITIPQGSLTGSITVTAVNNSDDTDDADVDIEIVSTTNCTEATPQSFEVTIVDDDLPRASISSVDNSPFIETGGIASIQLQLDRPSWQNITVIMSYGGNAVKDADYATSLDTIIFPAGVTQKTYSITGLSDPFDEDLQEVIAIEIDAVLNGAEFGTQVDTAYILDDDATPQVSFDLNSSSVAEDGDSTVVRLDVSAVSNRDITVYYSLQGSAESGGVDYSIYPDPLVISAGDVIDSLTVVVNNDVLDEDDEYLLLIIDSLKNADVGIPDRHTMTILDNDTASIILTVDKANIAENGGTANLSAALTISANLDVHVYLDYAGVAGHGVDFTADTVITIPTGQLSASIPITAINDGAADTTNEQITITVDSVQNGSDASTPQTITIVDAITPKITVAVDKTIMDETADSIMYTATIDIASAQDVVFDLIFAGTAQDTVDFSMVTTITIPAGEISKSFYIVPVEDTDDEQNESIIISIDSTTMINGEEAAGIGSETKTIQIVDDDIPEVTLVATNNPLFENGGEATLTAVLSGTSWQNIEIALNFSGTALEPDDYMKSDSVIIIPSGSLSRSITITGVDDLFDENDETVIVDIVSVTNGIYDSLQQQIIGITDDDATPELTLIIDKDTLQEDSSDVVTVTAQLSEASGRDVQAIINISGTALEGASFDYLGNDTLFTIAAGATSDVITFITVLDAVNEEHETIVIAIDTVINVIDNSSIQTIVIKDDDKPKVTLSVSQDTLREDQNALLTQYESSMEIRASLSILSFQEVRVYIGFSGTSNGLDYALSDTVIVIPAGANEGIITLSVPDDVDCEDNETLFVGISSLVNGKENGGIGAQVESVIIMNDDPDPDVSIALDTNRVTENAGTATLTATLSALTWQNVDVLIDFAGSAVDGTDYSRSNATITIPAGDMEASIGITAIDDDDDLEDVAIEMTINSVTNAIEAVPQLQTLILAGDDTPLVSLAVDTTDIPETGGVAQVTASMQRTSWQDVTVYFGYQGQATPNTDYSAVDSVIITSGALSTQFSIASINDSTDDDQEMMRIAVDSVINADENGEQEVSITIVDDEEEPEANDTTFTIAESVAAGSVVGTLLATDADIGDVLTFRVLNDDSLFVIDPGTGVISLHNQTTLDFEQIQSYQLTIRVTDNYTKPINATVEIVVENINDNEPVLTVIPYSVSESSPNDTAFGVISAVDADDPNGDLLTFEIISGNEAGIFFLDPNDTLYLKKTEWLNYDDDSLYVVTIAVHDPNFSDTNDVVVNVRNYNYAPTITNDVTDSLFIIEGYSEIGTLIGEVTSQDDDSNTVFKYDIIDGNRAGKFNIDTSGVIRLVSIVEPNEFYNLLIEVSDQGGQSVTQLFGVQVVGLKDTIEHSVVVIPVDTVVPGGDVPGDSQAPIQTGPVIEVDPFSGSTTERYTDGTIMVYDTDGSITENIPGFPVKKTQTNGTVTTFSSNGCYTVITDRGVTVSDPFEVCPEASSFIAQSSATARQSSIVNTRFHSFVIIPEHCRQLLVYRLNGSIVDVFSDLTEGEFKIAGKIPEGIYIVVMSE